MNRAAGRVEHRADVQLTGGGEGGCADQDRIEILEIGKIPAHRRGRQYPGI